jgi:glycosyltransferase involved in cell wall biosynthesis
MSRAAASISRPTRACRAVLLVGAGNSIHLQRWANALARAGLRLHVATVHPPLASGWLPAVTLHHLRPGGAVGYAGAVPALRRLVHAQCFDLVHAHYATGYGVLATLANCRPRLVSVWGSDVDDFPDKSVLHAALLRRVLRSADALAATSQALARRVHELLPLRPPGQQLHLTPFGVDTEQFAPAAAPRPDGAQLVIGSSKGLEATYGIDVLLRAFAQLPRVNRDGQVLQLRLLADGPQVAEYRQLAHVLGLGTRVQFGGGLPHGQMAQALNGLDVFVAPSRRESFGVSVLEASACARPVVASAVGGLPEVVQHGVTGLLVPPGDVTALAAALTTLADDAALRLSMGRAGRQMVQARYAWPGCVEQMMAAYDQVLGAPRPS